MLAFVKLFALVVAGLLAMPEPAQAQFHGTATFLPSGGGQITIEFRLDGFDTDPNGTGVVTHLDGVELDPPLQVTWEHKGDEHDTVTVYGPNETGGGRCTTVPKRLGWVRGDQQS